MIQKMFEKIIPVHHLPETNDGDKIATIIHKTNWETFQKIVNKALSSIV